MYIYSKVLKNPKHDPLRQKVGIFGPPYTPLAVEGSHRPVEGRWKPPTALHYLLSFTT